MFSTNHNEFCLVNRGKGKIPLKINCISREFRIHRLVFFFKIWFLSDSFDDMDLKETCGTCYKKHIEVEIIDGF